MSSLFKVGDKVKVIAHQIVKDIFYYKTNKPFDIINRIGKIKQISEIREICLVIFEDIQYDYLSFDKCGSFIKNGSLQVFLSHMQLEKIED